MHKISSLNWDDLKLFAIVAREGSLSAAAVELGISQPTAGRRLASLQTRMRVPLVRRTGKGYVLTDDGKDVLKHVDEMLQHALTLERSYGDEVITAGGIVRISAPEWLITYVVAPCFAEHTGIRNGLEIELVGDSFVADLDQPQATLCLRFQQFEEPKVVQKHLTTVEYGLYASSEFLRKNGFPEYHCSIVPLIGMGIAFDNLPCMNWLREKWATSKFVMRSNNRETQARACCEGIGIAVLPVIMGNTLDLVRIDKSSPPPERKIWLGYHSDLRNLKRLRLIIEQLIVSIPQKLS